MDFHFLIRRQKRIKTLKTAAASFSRNGCGTFIILKNSQRVDFHHGHALMNKALESYLWCSTPSS